MYSIRQVGGALKRAKGAATWTQLAHAWGVNALKLQEMAGGRAPLSLVARDRLGLVATTIYVPKDMTEDELDLRLQWARYAGEPPTAERARQAPVSGYVAGVPAGGDGSAAATAPNGGTGGVDPGAERGAPDLPAPEPLTGRGAEDPPEDDDAPAR